MSSRSYLWHNAINTAATHTHIHTHSGRAGNLSSLFLYAPCALETVQYSRMCADWLGIRIHGNAHICIRQLLPEIQDLIH